LTIAQSAWITYGTLVPFLEVVLACGRNLFRGLSSNTAVVVWPG